MAMTNEKGFDILTSKRKSGYCQVLVALSTFPGEIYLRVSYMPFVTYFDGLVNEM